MKPVFITILFATSLLLISFSNKDLTPYAFPKIPYTTEIPLPEDYIVTQEGVELGRYLFYDTILSLDSSISCASCHKQQFAFSGGPIQFNKGIDEIAQKRNTPPLFNLAWHPYFFTDGRVHSLEEFVSHPLKEHSEMRMDWQTLIGRLKKHSTYKQKFKKVFQTNEPDSVQVSIALAQFLRSLISNDSKFDKALRQEVKLNTAEREGFILFNDQVKGACLHCHFIDGNGLGSNFLFSNNGLIEANSITDFEDAGLGNISKIPSDFGKFKTPSIRNIGLTAPYMHDGSLSSLEDVLHFYNTQIKASINIDSKITFAPEGGVHLNKEELNNIKEFLHSLSDSTFISNPQHASPY